MPSNSLQLLYNSFVNSQEWTLPRTVPEIKLGILGSPQSGKSALVHRYLTGSYLQEESPEGGRFKKEVSVDGRSYLLLIRDEGGFPEPQLANWVDAVIFVFSLEDVQSYNDVRSYYNKMAAYRSTAALDLPVILIGTQDAINESNPRSVDEEMARRLQSELQRCPYYETCATYGLNVERVFQEACQRVALLRSSLPASIRCSTPASRALHPTMSSPHPLITDTHLDGTPHTNGPHPHPHSQRSGSWETSSQDSIRMRGLPALSASPLKPTKVLPSSPPKERPVVCTSAPLTAPATPNTIRKNRRRSNMLSAKKSDPCMQDNEPLGVGRPIPKKQGFLHKRTGSGKGLGLSRESRKKKYCVLFEGGKLVYYTSMNDYMNASHGKAIPLYNTSVRMPGLPPQGVQRPGGRPNAHSPGRNGEKVLLTAYELLSETADHDHEYPPPRTPAGSLSSACEEPSSFTPTGSINGSIGTESTPHVGIKKRQRRLRPGLKMGESANATEEDTGEFEFTITSLDNQSWVFEASTAQDRDEWVAAIQQEIHDGFCQRGSDAVMKNDAPDRVERRTVVETLRRVPGNERCADCFAPDPMWASLSLGVCMCIDCCGVHRQLGSHVSKVRSLDLDDWTPWLVQLMTGLGNRLVNSVWEGQLALTNERVDRTDRQSFIQDKYRRKRYLASLPPNLFSPLQLLMDSIEMERVQSVILALAHLPHPRDDLNRLYSHPTGNGRKSLALHLACQRGNPVLVQLLLWHDADVGLPDDNGRLPIYYAQQSGSTQSCQLLQSATSSSCGPKRPLVPDIQTRLQQLERMPASII